MGLDCEISTPSPNAIANMSHVEIIPVPSLNENRPGKSGWSLSAETESEIATLAAVCHAKQQQREPLTNSSGALAEDLIDDDEIISDTHDVSSICAATLTTDTTASIKMDFLDRLAEIFCNHKEASHISCTSLIARADNATVLVARNAKWATADIELARNIAIIMEQVASHEPLQSDVVQALSIKLANHYTARLRYHVQLILKLLEKHKVIPDEANVVRTYRLFHEGKVSAPAVVEHANDTAGSTPFIDRVRSICDAHTAKHILDELQCIRRPQLACNAICRAAQDVDSFQKVEFLLLAGYPPKKVKPSERYIFQLPKLSAKNYLAKLKWVHAEIRMITYLLSHDTDQLAFHYLGISKKTCLLCGHIVQQLGKFKTRSNHGKIYSQWTVPSNLQLGGTSHGPWELAVQKIRDVLRKEAARHDLLYIEPVKESTVAVPVAPQLDTSDVFTALDNRTKLKEPEALWLSSFCKLQESESKLECDEAVDVPRDVPVADEIETQTNHPPITDEGYIKRSACSHCHCLSEDPVKCSKCDSALYCDRDCRQNDWLKHKFRCNLGRSLDAADYLVRYCHQDQYPSDDDEVDTAFGFRYFIPVAERLRLFGIYCKLVRLGGVDDDELREARKSKKLQEFILYRGQQLRPELIRNDLIWLRAQKGFAADSITDFGAIIHSARDILGSKHLDELDTVRERQACMFYCQIRNDYVPELKENNWLELGFCAARTSKQRDLIGDWYKELIGFCTFPEFCQAMETSTMVALFSKYELNLDVDGLHNFKTLLQTVGKWHQSVWELKRFTLSTEREPMRAVFVDYGFRNCESAHDRMSLKSIYSKYFAMGFDAMDLHKACIEGNLSSFLESTFGKLPIRSEVFRNPYPLDRCDYMGLVTRKVVICSESNSALMVDKHRAEGDNSVVWTFPDNCDADMARAAQDRAANVTGHMKISKSRFRDQTVVSMTCS